MEVKDGGRQFECPIGFPEWKDQMEYPTITPCRHTFEFANIMHWFGKTAEVNSEIIRQNQSRDYEGQELLKATLCPDCREPINEDDLKPNDKMIAEIKAYQLLHPLGAEEQEPEYWQAQVYEEEQDYVPLEEDIFEPLLFSGQALEAGGPANEPQRSPSLFKRLSKKACTGAKKAYRCLKAI